MTIDRMDTRVDVTPAASDGTGAAPPLPSPASPQAAAPQGTQEILRALRPLVVEIVESELQMRLRIAGLR